MARKRAAPVDAADTDSGVSQVPARAEASAPGSDAAMHREEVGSVVPEVTAPAGTASVGESPFGESGAPAPPGVPSGAPGARSDADPVPTTAASRAVLMPQGGAETPVAQQPGASDDAKVSAPSSAAAAESASQASPASSPGSASSLILIDADPHVVGVLDRSSVAQALVQTHALVSAGAGFLPGIGIDVAAMSASQLWLLRRLSALYGVEFREDLGRSIVASLLAGLVPFHVVAPVAGVLKSVPLVGQFLGGLSMAAMGGIVTHTLGRAFIQHFESGGTLLTFDPQRVRAHFATEHGRSASQTTDKAH